MQSLEVIASLLQLDTDQRVQFGLVTRWELERARAASELTAPEAFAAFLNGDR